MFNLEGKLHEYLPADIELLQRAIFYNDVLFETMRVSNSSLPWMSRHWERLSAGMQLLGMQAPESWDAAFFEQEILKVAPPQARVRLTVWRAPGGLYFPENNRMHFMITTSPLEHTGFVWPEQGLRVCISQGVRLPVDSFSGIKTLNAPRYGAAAREARAAGYDDALIINAFDRICEATSSNIFWIKNGVAHTPPLSEACVAGVARAVLLERCARAGLPLQETFCRMGTLEDADEIFLTNAVAGLKWVAQMAGKHYENRLTRRYFAVLHF